MQRPRRDTQLPSRYREPLSPQFSQINSHPKRRPIAPEKIDRNDVDQALAVIAAAPEECIDELPSFIPTQLPQFVANYVENRPGYSQYTNLSEAGFFKLFFSDPVVEIISKETNAYADFHRQNPPLSEQATRHWVPTTIAEIRVYIGINLHFGLYPLTVRDDYWRIHKIGQLMGIKRSQQIHRFFSLNSNPITPSYAPWFYRIQAVAELIRTACQNAYHPSSYVAIDEAVVAFKGRSRDIIKIKGKPIDTGYKLWCIGDHGYIWTWLFHSRVDGVETFAKSQQTRWPQMSVDSVGNSSLKTALLAPTFALVLRLASQLPTGYRFCIYLDNLFLNVPVAQCLLAMGIYCMGTTRKKAAGVPICLQSYLDNNSELLWDSTIAEVVDGNTNCFVWEDNKPVVAISTAHILHRAEDRIQRTRRCPRITTENQRILNPVFKGLPFKYLFIPKAIDDYNHHMKGVDQADALRANFTCHRPHNYRTWWPLFYFLVDVSCVNAYLLWKRSSTGESAQPSSHRSHRDFVSALCEQLLHSNDKEEDKEEEQEEDIPRPTTTALQRHHKHIKEEGKGRCQWGRSHPPGCQRKRAPKRKFGKDIVNGASDAILGGSIGHYKCSKCQVWLCVEGPCWRQYHHSIGVNY
jgi:Transposase IS4